MNNEEHRRNQHRAAARGISGVLDTGQAEKGQPQELQHSGPQEKRDRLTPPGPFRIPGPQECKRWSAPDTRLRLGPRPSPGPDAQATNLETDSDNQP